MSDFLGKDTEKYLLETYGEDRLFFEAPNIVTIHFPRILIENENGQKHPIFDMYIRIKLLPNSIDFEGLRTTFTYQEFQINYTHSHLPSHSIFVYKNFCRGSVMTQLINNWVSKKNKKSLLLFFMTLDTFLSGESLAGGPHIKIAQVYNFNNSYSVLTLEEIKSVNPDHLNFGINNNKISITSIKNNAIFPDRMYTKAFSKYLGVCISQAFLTPNKRDLEGRFKDNQVQFFFKDKIVEFKLIDNEVIEDIEYEPGDLAFTNQIINQLNTYILGNQKSLMLGEAKNRYKKFFTK